MKVCRFCQAPINTGAYRHNKDLRSWNHRFDLREALGLLAYSCINCFGDVVRLQNVVPERPYRDEYDVRRARKGRIKWADGLTEEEKAVVDRHKQEPKAYVARCIARHVANLIAASTKEKTKKRRRIEEIVIHPDASHDREILMLEMCGALANFFKEDNRDMSSAARSYGTAAFWKSSAHFRHLRKQYGIKGTACTAMKPSDRGWDDGPAGRLRRAFYSNSYFRETLVKIEESLKKEGSYMRYWQTYVWQEVYENLIYFSVTPIHLRLQQFKFEKRRWAA